MNALDQTVEDMIAAMNTAAIDRARSSMDEHSPNFDERNYTDGAWWAEREAERREAE